MNALRSAVSGSCVRFVQDGFDLDLTYITPRLIAMAFPASGIEKTYRNSINDVSAFLASRHFDNYKVYNLSERSYDYSKFEDRVVEFGFPDNHPPPLQLLLDTVNDMLQWISEGFNHVAIVHCVDGKGRTGLVCSCYLLLTGYYGNVFNLTKDRELREIANSSIRDFWNARGQGVRFPSQALYIYYFVKVVWKLGRAPTQINLLGRHQRRYLGQIPPLMSSKKIFIRSIVLNGIPDFDAAPRGGCTPFLQILPAPSQHQQSTPLLYNSSWQRPRFETYKADPNGSIVFEVNVEVQGDVLLRCFHAKSTSMSGKNMVTMFHFTFNTDFSHNRSNVYRVPKAEVDEATRNERFPDTFEILCDIQVQDDVPEPAPESGNVKENNAEQDLVTPTMQGWLLYKQDGLFKNWKKWWVVAHEGKLMCYHGLLDVTPALEAVDLRGASVEGCESHDTSESSKRAHFFKVFLPSTGQRTLVFGTEAEQHLVAWIRAIGVHSVYGLVDTIRTDMNSSPSFDKGVLSSPVASTILAELPSKMLSVELPGTYIYSADELQEVARLEKFLCETRCRSTTPTDDSLNSAVDAAFGVKRSPHGSLLRQLQSCAVQKRMRDAELLLTELLLTKFPQLIDAMDCNPLAFTQLVVGGDTKAILDRDKTSYLQNDNKPSDGELCLLLEEEVATADDPGHDEDHHCQHSNQLEIGSTSSLASTESLDTVATHYKTLRTMCGEMHETSAMSKCVLERFVTIQLQINEQEDNRSSVRHDFRVLRSRFHAFLVQYKLAPAFERLVSARTVVDLLREFHESLDLIETNVAGPSISSSKPSWMEQWERERQEVEKQLVRLWETNAMSILDALPDQTSQENALLLLNCETNSSTSWDSSSVQSTELLRSITQHLVRLSGAAVPVVPGWFIPDHEVQRERSHFARGSFGKVYRGRWRGEKVVIKCVDVLTADDERDFSREARVWLRAQHPNVVRFMGACHLTRPCFFVCEEATNGNLVDFLAKNKERRGELVWRLLHGAAVGLQFLHQNNIVHGDLKCNQVLVSEDLTAKLTDFGMSFVSLESRPATTTGAVRWKAPELLSNKATAPTFASDVYSFGMCVVEAVSGRVPWQVHLPDIAVVYHLTHGELPSRPKEFTSDEQWEFVRKLCAFEPTERLDLAGAIKQLKIFVDDEELRGAGGHADLVHGGIHNIQRATSF